MAKTPKKDEKKLLLRLRKSIYKEVEKAATKNHRSVNGEIESALEQNYVVQWNNAPIQIVIV